MIKRLSWGLFFLLVVYFIFSIRQVIMDNLGLRKEVERAALNFSEENNNTDRLKKKIKQLKEDDLVEELARTRLGMIKKGETAYKVIRD